MRLYKFTAIFKPEKEEGEERYSVSVPALPEIATFGESLEEARFMTQDALELVILSKLEGGEKIPVDREPGKLSEGAYKEELLVAVTHQVKSTPVTSDVKATFA